MTDGIARMSRHRCQVVLDATCILAVTRIDDSVDRRPGPIRLGRNGDVVRREWERSSGRSDTEGGEDRHGRVPSPTRGIGLWHRFRQRNGNRCLTDGPQRGAGLWMRRQVADRREQYPNSDDHHAAKLDRDVSPRQFHSGHQPRLDTCEIALGRQISAHQRRGQSLGGARGLWTGESGHLQSLGHLECIEWNCLYVGTLPPCCPVGPARPA